MITAYIIGKTYEVNFIKVAQHQIPGKGYTTPNTRKRLPDTVVRTQIKVFAYLYSHLTSIQQNGKQGRGNISVF